MTNQDHEDLKSGYSYEIGSGEDTGMKDVTDELRQGSNGQTSIHMEPSLNKQVGGGHYKGLKIQPIEYIVANDLSWCEGNIVKYITRHRVKGEGREDIEKVIHYAEMLLELEYDNEKTTK